MTQVVFTPPGNGTDHARGYIEGRPVGTGDLPDSWRAVLRDGTVTVDVAPTVDTEWCWEITPRVDYGETEYVNVPSTGGPLDYDDLVRVDPDTLNPVIPPSPAWQSYIAAQIAIEASARSGADSAEATARVDADALKADLTKIDTIFKPEMYGTCPGNTTTDVTTFVNAAVTAAQIAGGEVHLDSTKTYRCNGALTPTYTGTGTTTVQKPVRITSPGATTSNGFWSSNPLNGGATLDLRYDGTDGLHPAKIDTRGAGLLEIDHVNIISGGTDDFPIFQTTNTAPHIHHNYIQGNLGKTGSGCKQDAFFFGGSTTGTTVGNTATAPFQGYGGTVHDNYFSNIRRGFVGRAYCNSIPVERNTFSVTCGNDGTGTENLGGAIEWIGSSAAGFCTGNIERSNTIECVHYKYAVGLDWAVQNSVGPSGYWDAAGPYVAGVFCGPNAIYNTITDGYHTTTYPLAYDPGLTNTIRTSAQSRASFYSQPKVYRGVDVYVNTSGQGSEVATTSGDRSHMSTINGTAGSPTYPTAMLQTVPAKTVVDLVTTSGSAIVTSATAVWNRQHQYMPIKATGIPGGTLILRYISATSVELSANCTITNTGVTAQFYDTTAGSTNEIGFSRRHIIGQGAIGAATVHANTGTGGTPSATAAGTDTAFTLTVVTANAGQLAGIQATVATGVTWAAVAKTVLTPKNAAAALAMGTNQIYCTNTTANFFLQAGVALPANTTLIFDVIQIQ